MISFLHTYISGQKNGLQINFQTEELVRCTKIIARYKLTNIITRKIVHE